MENRMEKLIKNIGHLSFRLPEDWAGLDGKDRAVMLDDVIDLLKEYMQGPPEVDWIPCKKKCQIPLILSRLKRVRFYRYCHPHLSVIGMGSL